MIIYFKKQPKFNINNIDDLDKFIRENQLFKHYRGIPDEFVNQLVVDIENTEKLTFKRFKIWYRNILKYPFSVYNPHFLYCMGWEYNDITKYITEKQKDNSKKISLLKKQSPEKYYESTNTRKEYWMKKGFSEEEAISNLSKRQRTFSKDICIEKYGHDKGLKIFNDRQKKWVKSLKSNPNISEIRKKQNSYTEDKSIVELIDRSSFIEETKNIIKEGIYFKNLDDFINFVANKIDIKSSSDLHPYISSKLIQRKYEVSSDELKNKFYKIVGPNFNVGYYGSIIYDDGIRYRSIKEYKISQLLKSRNVKYIYEKKYPNSKFICDFYLPEFDTYIEYYGMLDGKNFENLDTNQTHYYQKMIQKNNECKKNGIKLISNTNFNILYNTILNLITNESNN
jgi:hypothetical protein